MADIVAGGGTISNPVDRGDQKGRCRGKMNCRSSGGIRSDGIITSFRASHQLTSVKYAQLTNTISNVKIAGRNPNDGQRES